jgi:hypothetical protein
MPSLKPEPQRAFSSSREGQLSSQADTRALYATEDPRDTDRAPGEPTRRVGSSAVGRVERGNGGGADGNEQLTATTGVILIVLLATLGLTILRIRQLISVHLFVGFLLLGALAVKMAATGYRFARYYTGNPVYRAKGLPHLIMRLIAPIVVFSTVIVFASGVVLLFTDPSGPSQLIVIHIASFIIWLAATAVHVIGHLPHMPRSLRAAHRPRRPNAVLSVPSPGAAGRWIALAGRARERLGLAIVLVPRFAPSAAQALLAHDIR